MKNIRKHGLITLLLLLALMLVAYGDGDTELAANALIWNNLGDVPTFTILGHGLAFVLT